MNNEPGIIVLIANLIKWEGDWESHGRDSYTFYSASPRVHFGRIGKYTKCEWITINLNDKTISFCIDDEITSMPL